MAQKTLSEKRNPLDIDWETAEKSTPVWEKLSMKKRKIGMDEMFSHEGYADWLMRL